MTLRSGGYPLSASDSFHLGVPLDHIGCLLILNGVPDVERLHEEVETLLRRLPRLAAGLTAERNGWQVRPDFRARDHITVLPPSGPGMAGALAALAEAYCLPLLSDRPPWRIALVEFEDGGPRAALAFFIHHAFVDGQRGLDLVRALAGGRPARTRAETAKAGGGPLGRIGTALLTSLAELAGRRSVPPARADSGRRRFAVSHVGMAELRSAQRRSGWTRPTILAAALASGLCDLWPGARGIRLLIPQDAGACADGGGNSYVPVIETFDCRNGAARPSRDASLDSAAIARLAGADRLRLGIMAGLPARLRTALYHRWAEGFDALCTILPGGFDGLEVAGRRVAAAFGVPPLIWRQPLSCAILIGRRGADLLFTFDPEAIDAEGLALAIGGKVRQLAGNDRSPGPPSGD